MKQIFRLLPVIFLLLWSLSWAEEQPQQFEGFTLDGYSKGGTKSWDVTGDTANIEGNNISLTNINANSYGKETVNLKAKQGTINKESGQMNLENDVVITTETGTQLKTDALQWEREKDLVTTDKKVTLTRDEIIAEAMGAVAHPNLQVAQMNEDVKVKVKPEPGTPDSQIITITCDGPMEVDQLKQKAIFYNNVVAVQQDRQLKADKIELFIDSKTNQIKEMVCSGNVAITQGQNITYAEQATYRAGDQKLTLSGRPKLILQIQGENSFAPLGN